MMTDPMKPLGLSLFQLTAIGRMYAAGGRLFVDLTKQLATPASRDGLLDVLGRHDPLIKDALTTLMSGAISSNHGQVIRMLGVPVKAGQLRRRRARRRKSRTIRRSSRT
jgi:hypothetical protein